MTKMTKTIFLKYVAGMLILLFIFQWDYLLGIEKKQDYKVQFELAKGEYKAGNYPNAEKRLKRLLKFLNNDDPEQETIRKEVNELLKKIDKSKIIEKGTSKIPTGKKKKKFPTLLVAGGAAVVTVIIILLLKKKKPSPQPDFVVSSDNITVPEGGTATFNVRLSASPSSDVSASVARVSGDEDIIVQSGSSLTFTSANWSQPQTVTLAANEDVDIANGMASIRISGNNISNKDITAAEQDNDSINFVVSADTITVPERSTASFNVKLSNQPTSDLPVTVTRVSGDSDITVESGQNLTFTTSNWNTDQTVTLRAANDDDTANGQATIRLSASGVPDKDITAVEADDDPVGCTISVSISSPANNATVSGTVTIQASVSGTCLIDRVEFLVKGNTIYADTTSPYKANWDTSKEFEGSIEIKVVAYSTTGKTASDKITVTVTR
jgi:hypothetical protein